MVPVKFWEEYISRRHPILFVNIKKRNAATKNKNWELFLLHK